MDTSSFYSVRSLALIFFMQKIIGVNRKVPWPVHFTSQVKGYKKIQKLTQKNPGSALGCYIDARNGIIFENNVWVGPGVSIISKNHSLNKYTEYKENKPVIIKKNSLLSNGCIILAGVELGEHTIVSAGAVVTKSFKDKNQLIGGNPAELIIKLDDYSE